MVDDTGLAFTDELEDAEAVENEFVDFVGAVLNGRCHRRGVDGSTTHAGGEVFNAAGYGLAASLDHGEALKDFVVASDALGAFRFEHVVDQFAEFRRDIVAQAFDRFVLLLDLRHVNHRGGGTGECFLAGAYLVERGTDCIDIGTVIDAGFAGGLLGRHVVRSADGDAGVGQLRHVVILIRRVHWLGEAQVNNLDDIVGGDHDVLRLDVAMDDLVAVPGEFQATYGLARDTDDLRHGIDTVLFEMIGDGGAVDELHGDKPGVRVEVRFVDLRQVRVIDDGGALSFADKSLLNVLAQLWIGLLRHQFTVHEFDSHRAGQRQVFGEKYCPHTTPAQYLTQAEMADRTAGFVNYVRHRLFLGCN